MQKKSLKARFADASDDDTKPEPVSVSPPLNNNNIQSAQSPPSPEHNAEKVRDDTPRSTNLLRGRGGNRSFFIFDRDIIYALISNCDNG